MRRERQGRAWGRLRVWKSCTPRMIEKTIRKGGICDFDGSHGPPRAELQRRERVDEKFLLDGEPSVTWG